MQIFWNEWKKLFNWKILLILLLFTGMFYLGSLYGDLVKYYPNGSSAATLQVSKTILQKYGTTVTIKELDEYQKSDLPEIKKAVDHEIAGIKAFQDAKISTVDGYEALDETVENDKGKVTSSTKLYRQLSEALFDAEYQAPHPAPYELYEGAKNTVNMLRSGIESAPSAVLNAKNDTERKQAVKAAQRIQANGISVLPFLPVVSVWSTLAKHFSILLLFTAAILISPYLVREHRSGVRGLAYTCRKGRRLFPVQLEASVAAALLAAAVQFVVFFLLFCKGPHRDDLLFRNCYYTDFGPADVTFEQCLLWDCAAMLLLSFGFAFFSFAVSKFCRNYITVLAVQIPVIFLAGKMSEWIFSNLFQSDYGPWGKPFVVALCVLLPLAVCLFLNHREKAADILP